MCKDLEDNLAGVGEIDESEMHEGPEKEVMEESEEMHPATDSSDNADDQSIHLFLDSSDSESVQDDEDISSYMPPGADKDELLDDDDVLSLTSSDPEASALLASSPREQEMAVEGEAGEPAESSKPPCPAYAELLEVMERASGRLQLLWERIKKGAAHGWLDERLLSGHCPAAPEVTARLDLRIKDRAKKSSMASRAPPPPRSRSQRRRDSRKKQDLREVIDHRRQQRR
ncbi:hypothetical protein DPX16_7091 [Anabarilius grahami]|uniref:Uncharacterized protein n=1 Tax=Anabarilius grahami TaxID=495550 RepID=A0A3N0XL19_ANAGA|nr:hypothetical protein DPX16_7091 [Anabarilius grahami]